MTSSDDTVAAQREALSQLATIHDTWEGHNIAHVVGVEAPFARVGMYDWLQSMRVLAARENDQGLRPLTRQLLGATLACTVNAVDGIQYAETALPHDVQVLLLQAHSAHGLAAALDDILDNRLDPAFADAEIMTVPPADFGLLGSVAWYLVPRPSWNDHDGSFGRHIVEAINNARAAYGAKAHHDPLSIIALQWRLTLFPTDNASAAAIVLNLGQQP